MFKRLLLTPLLCCAADPQIEVKAGYFLFSNERMRTIYNSGGLDLQLSGSYPIWKWLQLYGSIEYLERSGRSLNWEQATQIWALPLSLGVKPVVAISSELDYYVTLGPRYFFFHQESHSTHGEKQVNENGLGGFINTGVQFFPTCSLLIDLFGEYSYKRFHSVQVGGFTFGGGIGYVF